MTKKMFDTGCSPGTSGGCSQNAATRPLAAIRSTAGFPAAMNAPVLYRGLVKLEISRASEHGARWWSRRLVEAYEEAGLVHLDN